MEPITTITNGTDSGPIPETTLTATYGRPKLTYTVSGLEPGTYQVDLTFMEFVYQSTGQRPLTATVNDQPFLKGFDVFAAAGFLQPVTRSILVVADTQIVVVISNDMGRSAILSGLRVTRTIL